MKWIMLVATIAMTACGDPISTPVEYMNVDGGAIDKYMHQQVLRVRVDASRNRLWVLGLDHVDVYDRAKKHLIRRIVLPGWYLPELICQPDMAVDQSGSVFISHNLQPKLLQIDPHTFQLKEHLIQLVNKEHWDIGFGRLAFDADGTLLAATASGGSIWKIDIANGRAHQVELSPHVSDECGFVGPVAASKDLAHLALPTAR